jgi:NIPSNAP
VYLPTSGKKNFLKAPCQAPGRPLDGGVPDESWLLTNGRLGAELFFGGLSMMDRRSFIVNNITAAALGSAALPTTSSALGAQSSGAKSLAGGYYYLMTMRLQFGDEMGRVLGWFEKRAFPLFEKHKFGPVGMFTVSVGPAIPSVVGIFNHPSMAGMEAAWTRLEADPDWPAARAELDAGSPAFYREDGVLLRATPFSPPLEATARGDPAHKIYELRIYESPTTRQLGYLHDRFAGGEIDVFHKSGIHPVLYGDTAIGPNMPNLTYLIPFADEGSRENAWKAFGSNPDWQRIRDESVKKGGEIVRNITNMFLSPTSFSMLR